VTEEKVKKRIGAWWKKTVADIKEQFLLRVREGKMKES